MNNYSYLKFVKNVVSRFYKYNLNTLKQTQTFR